MQTVIIKLDPKRVHKNAFYFSSIQKVIIKNLEFDDYFDMRIFDQKIEIFSSNEALINMLNELMKKAEDEDD